MRFIVFIFLAIALLQAKGQRSLSLQECYDMAIDNHPLGIQLQDLERINRLNQQVLSSAWLPGIGFSAQGSYQSDVTRVEVSLPGIDIPGPPHDQYRLSLEVQQLIYDAGISRRGQLQQLQHRTELQEIKVRVHAILEQVNRNFFQHFILEENLQVLDLRKQELQQRLQQVHSGVRNGVIPQSGQWTLEAELLRLQQAQDELKASLQSNLEILALLTGEDLSEVELLLPGGPAPLPMLFPRPERELFSLQRQQLLASARVAATETFPKVSGFAQAGYGRPGLNMLSASFETFYMVGIRFSWKLWDWQQSSRQRQILEVKAGMTEARQMEFERNIAMAISGIAARIRQLEMAMENDLLIIGLQEDIVAATANQLDNGIITPAEYIGHVNALSQARIDFHTRRIRLVQAMADYNIISGYR